MTSLSVRAYAAITGFIFAIVSMVHLVRLVGDWNFVVFGWPVPMWVSVLGLLIPGYLAWQGFRLAMPDHFRTHAKMPSG